MRLHGTTEMITARDCNLAGSTFEDVDLSGSSFRDVNFQQMVIVDANMEGVEIRESAVAEMTIDGVRVGDLFAAYRATRDRG